MKRALGAEALPFPVLSLNAKAQTEEEDIFTLLILNRRCSSERVGARL
jgi:hypothetical protein